MIRPGKNYINSNVRITARFFDDDDLDVDPSTVVFRVINPRGQETTYTYGSGDDVVKESDGNYYIDVTPGYSGKWFWRWQATGSGYSLADEGYFMVQRSEFYDVQSSTDYVT